MKFDYLHLIAVLSVECWGGGVLSIKFCLSKGRCDVYSKSAKNKVGLCSCLFQFFVNWDKLCAGLWRQWPRTASTKQVRRAWIVTLSLYKYLPEGDHHRDQLHLHWSIWLSSAPLHPYLNLVWSPHSSYFQIITCLTSFLNFLSK